MRSTMLVYHQRLLAFDHWANLETLKAVSPVAERAPKALTLVAHVAAAKRLWFARVTGTAQPLPVWPTLSLDQCRTELLVADEEWMRHLGSLTDADLLAQQVTYTNTRGERFTSPLADILLHLPLHGQHHRGQIAFVLREAGGTPPIIDFIHASRQGQV